MSIAQAIRFAGGRLRLLDQRRLPREVVYLDLEDHLQVARAISSMAVRGAPAIGIAAAYGLALAGLRLPEGPWPLWLEQLRGAAQALIGARPTAVNLRWAVERALRAASSAGAVARARERLLEEARRIHAEQEGADRRMAQLGAQLVPPGATVLTHCHTGSLATGGLGTALGAIREAWRQGRLRGTVVTETRPLLQGARLTAWELLQEGIPTTLIVDSAAGLLMQRGMVGCVMVGADRIARNGDVANKVGTYPLALLAREHGIPFYVVAPTSTLDPSTPTGQAIPVEERPPEEVLSVGDTPLAPEGVGAWNPAFDITPAGLVSAIVTEVGVLRSPFEGGFLEAVGRGTASSAPTPGAERA